MSFDILTNPSTIDTTLLNKPSPSSENPHSHTYTYNIWKATDLPFQNDVSLKSVRV